MSVFNSSVLSVLLLLAALSCYGQADQPAPNNCLGSGFENSYVCNNTEANSLTPGRSAFYSLQLLVSADEESQLLKRFGQTEPLHRTLLPGNQRFIYLGEYRELTAAQQARDGLPELLDVIVPRYRPMVVEFAWASPLPRIRVVATGRASEANTLIETESHRAVFSLQLGAFKGPVSRQRFVDRHGRAELYCRRMANGLYAVSLQRFERAAPAAAALADARAMVSGAYVVKLPGGSLEFCDVTEIPALPATEDQPVVYSIQLATFKGTENLRHFVRSYPDFQLYCRQKDNGLNAVYMRRFDSFQSAKRYLRGVPEFDHLGAYVVKLTGAKLNRCEM